MRTTGEADSFTEWLRAEIESRPHGIQAELAQQIGASPSTVNGIVNGKSRGLLKTRRALAKALGYNYDELMARFRRERAEKRRPAPLPVVNLTEEELMKLLDASIVAPIREEFRRLWAEISRLQPGSAVPADEFCNPLVRGSLVAPDAQPLKK